MNANPLCRHPLHCRRAPGLTDDRLCLECRTCADTRPGATIGTASTAERAKLEAYLESAEHALDHAHRQATHLRDTALMVRLTQAAAEVHAMKLAAIKAAVDAERAVAGA